jgi:hypothetical protein
MIENLPQRGSGLHQLERKIEHLGVAMIAQDQPLHAVEHAEALRHVVDRGVEQDALLA